MTEVMRHALLVLPILILVACSDDGESCDGPCKTADTKYNLTTRTIHHVAEKAWTYEDVKYNLVRVEYGNTPECDDDEEDCSYSTYCGFVIDNEDYPLDFNFVTDEDALFDEDIDLTGHELDIFDSEEFDEWLWETDSEDDILIECFEG